MIYMRWLSNHDLKAAHEFLLTNNFPHVPKSTREAVPFLKEARMYGMFKRGKIINLLIYVQRGRNTVSIDACFASPLTRSFLRGFFDRVCNYPHIVAHPVNPESVSLLEKLNFTEYPAYWYTTAQQIRKY
jgi:hypothetical protein